MKHQCNLYNTKMEYVMDLNQSSFSLQKYYENRIPIRIAQSSQRIVLLCHGQGLEPRLEFERTLVSFGPILPHSAGDDQEVVVRNPCSFPIEFYSLEFDNNYLEEEKVRPFPVYFICRQ